MTDDFDEFVAGNLEQLLRTAYLITWDAGEAEDLVQECLLKVARRWPRVRRMKQSGAYSRRILVNLVLDALARLTPRQRSARRAARSRLDRPSARDRLPPSPATDQEASCDRCARRRRNDGDGCRDPRPRLERRAGVRGLAADADPPAPGQLAQAAQACGQGLGSPVLTDSRGPYTAAIYADPTTGDVCLSGNGVSMSSTASSTAPASVAADQIEFDGGGMRDSAGNALTLVDGRTGADVTACASGYSFGSGGAGSAGQSTTAVNGGSASSSGGSASSSGGSASSYGGSASSSH